jgi:hypothetical protein
MMGSGMISKAVATLAVAGLGSGCLYLDGINGEPDAIIVKETPGPHVLSPIPVVFNADLSTDPENRLGALTAVWHAWGCNDTQGLDCDIDLASASKTVFQTFELVIDQKRTILVTLSIEDERGATDEDRLVLEVQNQDPDLPPPQAQGLEVNDAFPLGTYIDILAGATDPDGDELTWEWTLFPPDAAVDGAYGWDPVTTFNVPAQRLTPDVAGLWQVQVRVTDSDGGSAMQTIPVVVAPDQPPCLASIDPQFPGATYIMSASDPPRRFAALSVRDDLDNYPLVMDSYGFGGESTLRWFVATPDTGNAYVEIAGNVGADYILDPSGFSPGEQIGVRVEVADRIPRALPCAPGDATCSIDDDGCLQRVSWGVEIR